MLRLSLKWVLRASYEKVFTTEAQSSQSSEYFVTKNLLLSDLSASAVQFPSPYAEIVAEDQVFNFDSPSTSLIPSLLNSVRISDCNRPSR
jgi:hypothetical protein